MAVYLGPLHDSRFDSTQETQIEIPPPAAARPKPIVGYPPGTILAAVILVSMAVMFFGTLVPTLPFRFVGSLQSPLRFGLAMHDIFMSLAHAGLLVCGMAMLFRRSGAVRLGLLLVSMIWGANLGWQTVIGQYDLIIPTTGFAIFASAPLVYLIRTRPRKNSPPKPPAGRLLVFTEILVAGFILPVSSSIAFERPLGSMLDQQGGPESPAGSEAAPEPPRSRQRLDWV
jgi:hypothetical protein